MLEWMSYAALVAAVLAPAALALDAALRLGGRATRAVWSASLAASLALPAVALVPRASPPAAYGSAAREELDPDVLARLLATARERAVPASERVRAPLATLWALATTALLARLLVARRRVRRTAASWPTTAIDGARVRVSPDVGPAVIGAWRAEIVLPRWALDAEPSARALMLAHEREHVRARDPLLLAAASVAVALVPWSPAGWWMRRRLALAVEADCDRRVVRATGDAARYGHLLLDVARRAPARWSLAATPLAARPTHLQRRIEMLVAHRPRHAVARGLVLAASAAALAAAACEIPRPTAPASPRASVAITDVRPATDAPATSRLDVDAARAALAQHLPDVLSSRTGRAQRVWLVRDARGRVLQAFRDEPGSGMPAPQVSTLDPSTIASVDIVKIPAGRIAPDSIAVIAVRLGAPPAGSLERTALPERARVPVAPTRDSGRVAFRSDAPTTVTLGPSADRERTVAAGARGGDVIRLRDGGEMRMKTRLPAPLFVLDGEPLPAARARATVDALPPDAIAGVEVLKGDAALRRWGERARGGAVIVTTKR